MVGSLVRFAELLILKYLSLIKSVHGETGKHEFILEQLQPSENTAVVSTFQSKATS